MPRCCVLLSLLPEVATALREVMTTRASVVSLTFSSGDTTKPNPDTSGTQLGFVRLWQRCLSPSWPKSCHGLPTGAGLRHPGVGLERFGVPRALQNPQNSFSLLLPG